MSGADYLLAIDQGARKKFCARDEWLAEVLRQNSYGLATPGKQGFDVGSSAAAPGV
jgi:hypothetical protein